MRTEPNQRKPKESKPKERIAQETANDLNWTLSVTNTLYIGSDWLRRGGYESIIVIVFPGMPTGRCTRPNLEYDWSIQSSDIS